MYNSLKSAFYITACFFILMFVSSVGSDQPANPYQYIVERNVFGLKPAQPTLAPEPPKPTAIHITLTGITTILGDKRVLLKTPMSQGPNGLQTPEHYYILSVGQREGDIEVLNVDERSGNVTLNNAGTVMTLNIERDGPKSDGKSSWPLLLPPAVFPHPPGAVPPVVMPGRSSV